MRKRWMRTGIDPKGPNMLSLICSQCGRSRHDGSPCPEDSDGPTIAPWYELTIHMLNGASIKIWLDDKASADQVMADLTAEKCSLVTIHGKAKTPLIVDRSVRVHSRYVMGVDLLETPAIEFMVVNGKDYGL